MDSDDPKDQAIVKGNPTSKTITCPYCGFVLSETTSVASQSCLPCPACSKAILNAARFKPNPAKLKRRRQGESGEAPSSPIAGLMTSFNSLSRKPRFIMTAVIATIFITAMLARQNFQSAEPTGPGKPPKGESARASLCVLRTALELFKKDYGRFPTAEETLRALVRDPGIPGWKGPYIEALKNDPWQTPYYYALSNATPLLLSAGPDCILDTSDDIPAPPPDFGLVTGSATNKPYRETKADITKLVDEVLNESSNAPTPVATRP